MTPAEALDAALSGKLEAAAEEQPGAQTPEPKADEPKQPEAAAANTPEVKTPEAKDDKATGADASEVEAPIASKSGAYTIPFSKLTDARQERDSFKQQVVDLQAQLDALTKQQQENLRAAQEAADTRAATGAAPTKADADLAAAKDSIANGADPSLFGDYSEEALAKGISTLNQRTRDELRAELKEELKQELQRELEPIRLREQQAESDGHFGAIFKAHPDATEIAESAEFAKWQESLPSFMRESVQHVMQDGSTQDVIEVFDSFKKAGGSPAATPQAANLPEAKTRTPMSLSEISGTPPVDEVEQTLQLASNPGALLDRMNGMTPAQITALMNRV